MIIGQELPLPMFSDQDVGGQAPPAEAPAAGGQGAELVPGDPAEAPGQAPFHSYTNDKGEKTDFANADELNKYIRGGTLTRSDYTQKTQALSKMRNDHQQQVKDYNQRSLTLSANEAKLKDMSDFLRENPQVYQQIVEARKMGMPPEAQMQQSLDPMQQQLQEMSGRMDERDKVDAKREEDGRRESAFTLAGQKLKGFDRKAVEMAMDRLQQAAPGDEMFQFLSLLHDHVEYNRPEPTDTPAIIPGEATTSPRSKGGAAGGGKTPKKEAVNFAEAGELTKRKMGMA